MFWYIRVSRGLTRKAIMLEQRYQDSELVLGLIGAVGTDLKRVRDVLEDRLKVIGYKVIPVRVTEEIIPRVSPPAEWPENDNYARLKSLMDAGDEARKKSDDNAILALGCAALINAARDKNAHNEPESRRRHAYIISSLKHPHEVERLREIYPEGFYLIGVHADKKRRLGFLTQDKRIDPAKAEELIRRDEDEGLPHGQRVTDTFHMADFFVRIDDRENEFKQGIWRLLALLFGHPYVTPTFDEYAMFLAFAASLRSADLSRQVGAVVAVGHQVVATGCNDVPKAGGGQYWPRENTLPHDTPFPTDGRDFAHGFDCNKWEKEEIVKDILRNLGHVGVAPEAVEAALRKSRIGDLTEFGRMAHAEMEALLSCARLRLPLDGGIIYTTTFPCHNCAKHIVAAGIRRVVYIEPYQKSKAADFHPDSIRVGLPESGAAKEPEPMVQFEPFMGVGPRRFFDLFSTQLGSGYPVRRKDDSGSSLEWMPENGSLRLQMLPASYLDLEVLASEKFNQARAGGTEAEDAD